MRILLVALLIALFFIVTISKADNFSPESAEGARAVSTETAKETLIYSITSNRVAAEISSFTGRASFDGIDL